MNPPVIILGAGRSGTKILRDTLTSSPAAVTWNCDELPFLWRTGNRSMPHDEFTVAHARPNVVRSIRRAFERLDRSGRVVIEKTCANSLRPDFVRAVMPEARFIVLLRDGRDVVASAMKRWTGSTTLRYRLKKLRYSPPRDLPYYALRQVRWMFRQWDDPVKASWGPRFAGIDDYHQTHSLTQVCAQQWRRCVEQSLDFASRHPDDTAIVRYEELVRDPRPSLERITDELEVPELNVDDVDTSAIEPHRVDAWRNELDEATVREVETVADEVLHRLGYVS